MKLLDVDWRDIFDLLPKWEALTIEQRLFLGTHLDGCFWKYIFMM